MRQHLTDIAAVYGLRLVVAVTAPLLVVAGRSRWGRLAGAAVFVSLLVPFWCLVGFGVGYEWMNRIYRAEVVMPALRLLWAVAMVGVYSSFLFGVLLWSVVLYLPPRYRTDPAPGVSSLFLGPTWLHRWQLALPPEEDILWLGAWLVSRLDPWMTRAEGRRVRDGVRALLDDMAEYPEYRLLAPALGLAVWGSPFRPDHGHHFSYIPPHEPGERLGLVVALHGHGGNAKLWLHCWRAFADEHRFAVVCPSFGYGNWEHPASPAAVERCLSYALAHLPVDPARVYLAGLSQGGCGVGRAAAAMPDRFAGLVFLSPTMEPTVLSSPAFVEGWKGRPVLVVYGGRDHNVKPHTVATAIDIMRADGADVTVHLDPAADHFLFFAQLDAMHRRIGDWIAAGRTIPGHGNPRG